MRQSSWSFGCPSLFPMSLRRKYFLLGRTSFRILLPDGILTLSRSSSSPIPAAQKDGENQCVETAGWNTRCTLPNQSLPPCSARQLLCGGDKVSIYRSGWPQTLGAPPPSASKVLGLHPHQDGWLVCLFIGHECFACMSVCVPCACLVSMEIRTDGVRSGTGAQMVVSNRIGAGNGTCVLCKNNCS